jgi:hypothetical protein
MTNEDIRKLLGGYATGTLSEAEQKALFEAALHDETLFEELAAEQGVKDLLDDPAHRAELLRALDAPPRKPWLWRWLPAAGALAGVIVVASVVINRLPPASKTAPVEHVEVARRMDAPIASPAAPPQLQDRRSLEVASSAPKAKAKKVLAPAAPSETQRPAAPLPAASLTATGPAQVAAVAPEKDTRVTAQSPIAIPHADRMEFADQVSKKLDTLTARAEENGVSLQAAILRRGSDAEFHPADAITTFRPGENVRLQLTSNAPGFVTVFGTVGTSRQAMYTGPISSGVALLVPVQLDNGDTKVTVAMTAGNPVQPAPFRTAVRTGNTLPGGAINGVIGGAGSAIVPGVQPEARAKSQKTESTRQDKAAANAPAAPLTLDLTLKVQ